MLVHTLGRLVSRAILFTTSWRIEGEFPSPRRYVVIGAPHTHTLDFFLNLALMGRFALPLRWMGKDSLFRGPLGPLVRAVGGFPVDRSVRSGMVEQLARAFEREDEVVLGILPEGTRKRTEHWKSGFYRLALRAKVPVVPVALDGARRVMRVGPAMEMTGDPKADMARIAEFYGDARGVCPERAGPIRLADEVETGSAES